MIEKEVIVSNTLGIHARPASLIVKLANQFKSTIHFKRNEETVDAKSIMNIMMLAAEFNTKIIIQANGNDEDQALHAIIELFTKKFHEE